MYHVKLFFRLLLVSVSCALIPCTALAQFGKPYLQWSEKEAKELVINSPWAQTQTGLVWVDRFATPTPAADSTITIRLYSALPLRQALARLRQIKTRYDRKSDRDKAAIDAKNRELLECPACNNYYMVTMSPGPDSMNGLPPLPRPLSFAVMKRNVYIKNEKGETRELTNFVAPKFFGDEALFFFARFNSKGEPLISPANRTLIISFDRFMFRWAPAPATLAKFEFDVAKMTVNGQIVF